MIQVIAAMSAHTSRRVTELGALLGVLAGIAIAAGVMPGFRRLSRIIGGVLLALGFVLIIVALHFGKTF